MASSEDELIGIPFPEHSSDLLSNLNEQRLRGVLCDITIKTQGLEYRTHRAVLAACSHYFRKLFTGARGSGKTFRDVCQLDFLKPDALGALLDFAYTATLTISNSNMRDVLRAARLLEIPCVVDACMEILRCNGSSWEEMGGDTEDLEGFIRARQYLECYGAQENGEDATPPPEADSPPPPIHSMLQPQKPVQLIPRKHRRKFLQVNPSQRIQNGSPNLMEDESMERADSPAEAPSPSELVPSDSSYGRFTPDHGLGGHHIFVPPSPPDDLLSDEEPSEIMYPTPLDIDNPESLSVSLDGTDKLVRKRRSQMPQECPVCHKIIHGAGKLPRHMRTHTGEKPFVCQVCGVRFTRNDKLKIHMRKHTGERPYCCEHCSARFLHSYDLKNHMHLHTGDRPYECSLCHKAFAKEDHLQRHMKGQNCLEVRTRRRRKEDPPVPRIVPTPGLDLTNGKMDEMRLSMLRFWPLPHAPSGEGSPEGPLVIDNS
ncbi:zinc finger and BTB domain-containing protein 7B [Dendrobates tinctorius]|uniref:zinc finger and BTB domain-containing protein 7B n=1 Tax=Dendrobates tinctorius TaxID=92724 RepID=UPI003CC9980B